MHLVPVAPRIARINARNRRQGARCGWHRAANEAIDEIGLQTQLLGVGDVLPRAAATRTVDVR